MRHQGHERGVKPIGKVRRMIFKCLLGLVLACSILLISVLSWGASIVWRSKPDYDGLLRNPQLQAEVTILRDQWGVPHIQASHLNDAWFALGFTVAQDRLPQLVWFKLLGQGRLSEVFGLWEPVKKIDLLMRGFQLHQVGQRMLDLASPEAKQAFRAYYAGVNLFLERQSVLPLELELLQLSGYEIEPFADDDLVGMVGVMALQLHLAMRKDLLAEKLARQVGEEKLR
ncbi:MAG: penicillin acylase family protein, partial [bacterium]